MLDPNGSGGPETPSSYGVFLHNYRNVDVQLNTFTGTANIYSEEWGLVSQQLSGNSSGIVSRNDFTTLSRGFQPQQNNTALQVKCNEFFNNQLDWHVNPLTLGNFANQGLGCGPNDYRPGNLFLDQGQNHILSQQVIGQNGSGPAWYYYSRGGVAFETPVFQNLINLGDDVPCQSIFGFANPCPNGTGARLSNDLQAIRLSLESEIIFLENSATLLEDSLNNQQTDSLLAIVADTTTSTGSVYATLYNHSPLSDNVMLHFLNRDSITSSQFISLFSFNLPCSASLMDSLFVYKLNHSLDSTAWDSIQKLQAFNPNFESITQIKRSIEFYHSEWKRVVAQIERALIEENEMDELIAFYKDSLGFGYEKETFGAYLSAGNASSARNWLQNNLLQNNASDSAFVGYHNLYLDLKEDSISWLQLNSAQLAHIHQWASEESEIQHLALAVLALRGDTVLNELPEFSNPPSAKYANVVFTAEKTIANNQNRIAVFPNPSNGLFTLELESEIENLRVGVYDVTGRNVFENQWYNKSKTQSISLQHLSSGVYYLQVLSGNQFIGVKPIVIRP